MLVSEETVEDQYLELGLRRLDRGRHQGGYAEHPGGEPV